MSFSYSRYSEIVEKINSLADVLNEVNEDNYMSFKVQDTLCRVIQEANRVYFFYYLTIFFIAKPHDLYLL